MKFTFAILMLSLLVPSIALCQEQLVDATVQEEPSVALDIEQAPVVVETTTQPQDSATVDPDAADAGYVNEQEQNQGPVEEKPVVIEQPIVAVVQVPMPQQPPVEGTFTLRGGVQPVELERSKWVGMTFGVGVPSAVQLGLSVRPGLQWVHVDVMANYLLKLGYAASVTLDPINFGVAPAITGEIGHVAPGKIPTKDAKDATLGWDYAQLLGGLEFGSRRSFRFYLRAGVAWINVYAKNVNSLVNNDDVTVGDPSISIRLCPTIKLGMNMFF